MLERLLQDKKISATNKAEKAIQWIKNREDNVKYNSKSHHVFEECRLVKDKLAVLASLVSEDQWHTLQLKNDLYFF